MSGVSGVGEKGRGIFHVLSYSFHRQRPIIVIGC